jgi:hypothetical protein
VSDDARRAHAGPQAEGALSGCPVAGSEPLEGQALTQCDKWRLEKHRQRVEQKRLRQRLDEERRGRGVTLSSMPGGLSEIRRWVRTAQDAFSVGVLTQQQLAEARRSAQTVAELYKASSIIRQAQAQEDMIRLLSEIDHGGAAVALLEQMRQARLNGTRRPRQGAGVSLRELPGQPAGSVAEQEPGDQGVHKRHKGRKSNGKREHRRLFACYRGTGRP